MATYCTDNDLLKIRPNILELGVSSWEDQREIAYTTINRVIRARWYQSAAVAMGYDPLVTAFDPTRVQDNDLNDLECYKTLELAYMYLAKDQPEQDGFERLSDKYARKYGQELEAILGMGLSYDWSGDGEFEYDETYITSPRRISRS